MSLIYSAIIPHSPLLIPAIGKNNTDLLKKTTSSFAKIEEELLTQDIETLVVISSHSNFKEKIFALNFSPEFEINFEEFGDFASRKKVFGDILLSHKIKKYLLSNFKVRLINKPGLNHGVGVPLYLLTKNLKNLKIIPVYCSEADLATHFAVGENIQKTLIKSNKRIAVLASGDLSHTLSQNAPGGYSPKAAKFDQKIIDYLQNKKNQNLTKLNPNLIEEVQTEGVKPFSLLSGIMNKINYSPKLLAYEHPFGVGYLTMSFYF